MTSEPERSDAEIEAAVVVCAQACVEALSPTDPIQVEANVLALNAALEAWPATDLRRLVICLAAAVTVKCRCALEAEHDRPD